MRRIPAAMTIAAAMILAMIAVVFLSTGIESLVLHPAAARAGQDSDSIAGPSSASTETGNLVGVLRVVWAVLAVIIVLCLLFWPSFRRLILKYMLAQLTYFTILFMLAALIFVTMRGGDPSIDPAHPLNLPQAIGVVRGSSSAGGPIADPASHQSPAVLEIPLWQMTLIAVCVVTALLALLVGAFLVVRRIRSSTVPISANRSPLHDVAIEADRAADRLQAGEDPAAVILECYRRMVAIATRHAGVDNRSSLTPRELAELLSSTRIRADHVDRLTAIFEQVRYGARLAAPYTKEALACLAAVCDDCTPAG